MDERKLEHNVAIVYVLLQKLVLYNSLCRYYCSTNVHSSGKFSVWTNRKRLWCTLHSWSVWLGAYNDSQKLWPGKTQNGLKEKYFLTPLHCSQILHNYMLVRFLSNKSPSTGFYIKKEKQTFVLGDIFVNSALLEVYIALLPHPLPGNPPPPPRSNRWRTKWGGGDDSPLACNAL
jgi:hypothetical protein